MRKQCWNWDFYKMTKTGIDAIHYYVPSLVLPISALAEARGIEYAKLNKGLGLEGMALCDADEDVATMAAEAAINLIEEQGLEPQEIDRIYLGTESALDAAKPTAAYILGIIEDRLQSEYGERCLQNCDVIDMTFACIGGVDALLNSADYIRLHPQSKAIVIAADKAQYDLASTGEYTQGAGAVAMCRGSRAMRPCFLQGVRAVVRRSRPAVLPPLPCADGRDGADGRQEGRRRVHPEGRPAVDAVAEAAAARALGHAASLTESSCGRGRVAFT